MKLTYVGVGVTALALLAGAAQAETVSLQQSSGAFLDATVAATGSTAWGLVDQSQSTVVPAGASWTANSDIWELPSSTYAIDPSTGKVTDPCQNACSPYYGGAYGNPSTAGAPNWQTTPFWVVFAPNTSTPSTSQAVLNFSAPQSEFSLLWGSPDNTNLVELLLGGTVVGEFSGADFGRFGQDYPDILQNPGQGDVLLSLTGVDFDSLRFISSSGGGSFEFSNIGTVAAVPVPATAILLLSAFGLIALGRKRPLRVS